MRYIQREKYRYRYAVADVVFNKIVYRLCHDFIEVTEFASICQKNDFN